MDMAKHLVFNSMTDLVFHITGDNGANIRGKELSGGIQVFSVYDFITKACSRNDQGTYARKTFQLLISDDSEFKSEVISLCQYVKFPGAGQRDTPVMTIRGLQRLLMILGGKVAKEFRALVETTFSRVMAGDLSMIDVIESNNMSNGAIQQAYRAGLKNDPSPGDGPADNLLDSITRKRTREEMEICVGLGQDFELSLENSAQQLRDVIALRKELGVVEIEQTKAKIALMKENKHNEIALMQELKSKEIEKEKIKMELVNKARAKEFEFNRIQRDADLEHERAMIKLADETRAKILAHERAMRLIKSPRTEPVVITPIQVKEPTITVQNVYLKNKSRFPHLNKKKEGALLSNAGKAAKEAYKTKHGEFPSTKDENGQFIVASYPLTEEALIMESLNQEYRKLMAGSTPSLQKFFWFQPIKAKH